MNSPTCSWRSFEVDLLAGEGGGSREGSWLEEAVEGVTAEAIRVGAGRFDGALGWEGRRVVDLQ
jgi:hypothetical protein